MTATLEGSPATQRRLRIAAVRFVLLLAVNSLSLALTFWLLPGLAVTGSGWGERALILMAGVLIINVVNFVLKPVLRLLAIPLGVLILFGAGLFINAGLLEIVAVVLPGFEVDGWVSAFAGSVVMTVANILLIQLATDERLGPFVSPRALPQQGVPNDEIRPIRAEKKSFTIQNLREGIGLFNTWPRQAWRTLLLNRGAYAAVAEDERMTGPALLITLAVAVIGGLLRAELSFGVFVLRWILIWVMAITFFYAALRILRSKTPLARIARVVGFAQTTYLIELLAVIPALAPLAIGAATFLNFVASVIGVAEAGKLRGWRAWVIPGVALAFVLMRVYFLQRMLDGLFVTLQGLLARIGIIPVP